MHQIRFCHFYCLFVLALSLYVDQFNYLMLLVGFKNIKTGLIKKPI